MIVTSIGTGKRETAAASIKLADTVVEANDIIICTVAYKSDVTPQSCYFGEHRLLRAGQRVDVVNGFGVTTFVSARFFDAETADLNVAWAEDIGARVITAYTVDCKFLEDQISRNLQSDSDAPNSGYSGEAAFKGSLAYAVLCSNGPDEDTPPSWEAGWTVGNRKGTSLVTDTDNITIFTGYQLLSTIDPVRARATGATIRDWANTLTILRPVNYPALDMYEFELEVGSSVNWNGASFTIDTIEPHIGTIHRLLLSHGSYVWSYDVIGEGGG